MKVTFQNREVEIEEFEDVSYDHDYWCDAFISNAYWVDTDTALSDDELDLMNDDINKDEWIMSWLY